MGSCRFVVGTLLFGAFFGRFLAGGRVAAEESAVSSDCVEFAFFRLFWAGVCDSPFLDDFDAVFRFFFCFFASFSSACFFAMSRASFSVTRTALPLFLPEIQSVLAGFFRCGSLGGWRTFATDSFVSCCSTAISCVLSALGIAECAKMPRSIFRDSGTVGGLGLEALGSTSGLGEGAALDFGAESVQ